MNIKINYIKATNRVRNYQKPTKINFICKFIKVNL